MKSCLLITGANGYLGSKLVETFRERFTIIALEKNCTQPHRLQNSGDIILKDISKDSMKDVFSAYKPELIVHAATLYGRNGETDLDVFRANTYSMLRLLETAMQEGLKLFINTDTVLDRMVNPYSLSKKQLVDWLTYYAANKRLNVVNIEVEHFYGPGAGSQNFISNMISRLLSNEKEIGLTAGEQERDFLYIDDLLKVYTLILSKKDDFSGFHNFRACTGEVIRIRDLMELMKQLTRSGSGLLFGKIPYRSNELMKSGTDNSGLRKLGWRPETRITEGLKKVIEYEKSKLP